MRGTRPRNVGGKMGEEGLFGTHCSNSALLLSFFSEEGGGERSNVYALIEGLIFQDTTRIMQHTLHTIYYTFWLFLWPHATDE